MPKRDLLHEWMHRFEMPKQRVVRVWAKRSGDDIKEFWDQHLELGRICEHAIEERWLTLIAELGYVNAAEVLDSYGNGRLVYVDWP